MTLVATATFLWVWWQRAGFEQPLIQAMAVLSISCPCALSLVASIAILTGLASVTKQHILFRSSAHFETLQNTTNVVLDKTGTISSEHPTVTQLHSWRTAYPELALHLLHVPIVKFPRSSNSIWQSKVATYFAQQLNGDGRFRAKYRMEKLAGFCWQPTLDGKNGVSFTIKEQKEFEQWKEQRESLSLLALG